MAKGEAIIANAIGVLPQEIWPERYYREGELVERRLLIRNPLSIKDLR